MGVTGLRQGQRSQRVTLFMLRHWQHPLNLLAWEDPQRVGGYLTRLIGSLELTKVISRLTCQSVCVSAAFLCIGVKVCVSRSVKCFHEWKDWNVKPCSIYMPLCTSASLFVMKADINTFIIHQIIMDLISYWLIMLGAEGAEILRGFVCS